MLEGPIIQLSKGHETNHVTLMIPYYSDSFNMERLEIVKNYL